jgi:hypothetical protein
MNHLTDFVQTERLPVPLPKDLLTVRNRGPHRYLLTSKGQSNRSLSNFRLNNAVSAALKLESASRGISMCAYLEAMFSMHYHSEESRVKLDEIFEDALMDS